MRVGAGSPPRSGLGGQDALTEALMYVKAGRAFGMPVALELSAPAKTAVVVATPNTPPMFAA